MWKCLLTVVCGVSCLMVVNTETTQAKPPAGRALNRAKPQPIKTLPPKTLPHNHKHKQGGGGVDIDGGGDFGDSADGIDTDSDGIASDDADNKDAKGALYGVEITGLFKGTANDEGLEIGDIIISFNGIPTPDFDTLANAVARAGNKAQVVVIRDDNGKRETVTLYPKNGRIGLSGESVRVDDD